LGALVFIEFDDSADCWGYMKNRYNQLRFLMRFSLEATLADQKYGVF